VKFSMVINDLKSFSHDFALVQDCSKKIYDVCNPTSAAHKPEAAKVLGEACPFSMNIFRFHPMTKKEKKRSYQMNT